MNGLSSPKSRQALAGWLALSLLVILAALGSSPPAVAAQRDALRQAKACSRRLYRSRKRMRYREQWLRCIRAYEAYCRLHPKGRQVAEALYATGRLYQGLYGRSWRRSDLHQAIKRFRQVIRRYPKSRFADDAQYRLGEIYLKYSRDPGRAYVEFFKVVMNFPRGDMRPRAQKRLQELEAKRGKGKRAPLLPPLPTVGAAKAKPLAKVTEIRHWSAPDYTRVVIDVEEPVAYRSHLLKADPALKTPPRLYLDLDNARLLPALAGATTIGDGLLRKVRAAQHLPTVVRVVLDIDSISQHKIFSLNDPFRIVVDVVGKSTKRPALPGSQEARKLTLAQQLGLGVEKVVIDPGHGGKDPGAIGPRGITEKRVVLAIARRLQQRLRKELRLKAVLTRDSDKFLPLEERTAIANTQKADLFISIHTNANRDRRAQGVSTYILNVATDAEAARLAAFENAVSTKRIGDLEKILTDLMLNAKINESTRLAQAVQQGLVGCLQRKYRGVKNLGVKQAPFYVLVGARMPCILVEASFISNPREARRLASSGYQDAIARGIVAGIRSYIKQIESVPGQG